MPERNPGRSKEPKRFRRELTEPKPIREGAWETVIVALKTELALNPYETIGPGDSDFWIEIEDRATMRPNEAGMEFYIHGIGHRTLAEFVIFSFQTVRSALGLGTLDKDFKRIMTDRISNKLLPLYPPSYRAKFER